MNTHADVIDALGVNAVAQQIGKPSSHVRTMRARKSIPPEYWFEITKMAEKYHLASITMESLGAMRAAAVQQATTDPRKR